MSATILLALCGTEHVARSQDWPLRVHPGVERGHPEFTRYQRLAGRLTAARLPPNQVRLAQFKKEEGVAYPAIRGWYGTVQGIEYIRGTGLVATVRTSPKLDGCCYDSHYCLERYLITAREVRFIDAAAPPQGTPRFLLGL